MDRETALRMLEDMTDRIGILDYLVGMDALEEEGFTWSEADEIWDVFLKKYYNNEG